MIIDWIEQHLAFSIIASIFAFQFLAFLYEALSNKLAENKVKQKKLSLEREYNEKINSLQSEYVKKTQQLQNEFKQNNEAFSSWQQNAQAEINSKYRQLLIMNKLYLTCMESAFVFDKTAIDDTLLDKNQFLKTIKEDITVISPVQIAATIRGASGHTYSTTLRSCSCPDFQIRKRPCKHMYKLAEHLGFISLNPQYPRSELLQAEKLLNQSYVSKYEEIYHKCQQEYRNIDKIRNSSSTQYPWLAKLYAEYDNIRDQQRENNLREKRPPALKAAEEVKAIRQEKKNILQKAKMLEYQLSCYESLFPWLEDYKDISPTETYDHLQSHIETEDSEYNSVMRNWLSREEYDNLPNVKKYQLALDRYKQKKKSAWQIGIEYERYIGYLYECAGYSVRYHGALMGLEDMGRDLIADNGAELLIIQCKRWAKEKQIHEKHIFQLYGTMVLSTLQNPRISVKGVFVTTTTLTDIAKRCAQYLNIQVIESKPLADYPLIKCNISKNGEKIYHLPMDLQYDRAIITPYKGDCYVSTVKEAEDLGFRHAYRWSGSRNAK